MELHNGLSFYKSNRYMANRTLCSICTAIHPQLAQWIADRLNLLAKLERHPDIDKIKNDIRYYNGEPFA